MKPTTTVPLVACLLLSLFAAATAVSEDTAAEITIAFSSNVNGELKPCG